MKKGANPAIPLYLKNEKKEKPENLLQAIGLHEQWLDSNGYQGEKIDLSYKDLSGIDFKGLNLKKGIFWQSDFSNACLTSANLSESNLMACNFSNANLLRANLYKSDLRSALFTNTFAVQVNLKGAILEDAFLKDTKLRSADFRGAKLTNASFWYSDLTNANFEEAILLFAKFYEAIFGDTNLNGIVRSETINFFGPCTLDIRTLIKSRDLPLKFLQGCGLPETLITYLPSLLIKPLEYLSCFISYSIKDKEFVGRLYSDLQGKGVRCWYAKEDLKIGDKIRATINESIKVYDKILVVLSKKSLRSEWVGHEVELALEKEKKQNKTFLFPIRIDSANIKTPPAWFKTIETTRHIGDFSNWKDRASYKLAFNDLLKGLKESAPQE
ncbi:MAG TPA: toll/interleukin-1 receptor domain-containing protein [Nitrospirales bacterium]|nr:hypothetical protein [Nitrospiraceae bacterium]HNP28568.1 toll/interleukin-1 receptor domain-containing protein [Nitrospirales bacterium]